MSNNFSAPLKQIILRLSPPDIVDPYLFLNVPLRNVLDAIFSQAILLLLGFIISRIVWTYLSSIARTFFAPHFIGTHCENGVTSPSDRIFQGA